MVLITNSISLEMISSLNLLNNWLKVYRCSRCNPSIISQNFLMRTNIWYLVIFKQSIFQLSRQMNYQSWLENSGACLLLVIHWVSSSLWQVADSLHSLAITLVWLRGLLLFSQCIVSMCTWRYTRRANLQTVTSCSTWSLRSSVLVKQSTWVSAARRMITDSIRPTEASPSLPPASSQEIPSASFHNSTRQATLSVSLLSLHSRRLRTRPLKLLQWSVYSESNKPCRPLLTTRRVFNASM